MGSSPIRTIFMSVYQIPSKYLCENETHRRKLRSMQNHFLAGPASVCCLHLHKVNIPLQNCTANGVEYKKHRPVKNSSFLLSICLTTYEHNYLYKQRYLFQHFSKVLLLFKKLNRNSGWAQKGDELKLARGSLQDTKLKQCLLQCGCMQFLVKILTQLMNALCI